jgi:hypothetical protein
MLKRMAVIAALTFAPGAGQAAECPGPEAMEAGGVWVAMDDGGQIHYERGEGTLVRETAYFDGEDPVLTESHHGLYFARDATLKNGAPDPATVTRWTYPDVDAIPDPNRAGSWRETVVIDYPGAPSGTREKLTVRTGGAIKITVGECPYRARLVTVQVIGRDGRPWVTQYSYILSLGFAVLSAAGETPAAFEYFFRPVSISETRP